MFGKPNAGWCEFSLGKAKCQASYLTGGALDFVDAFIDRFEDRRRLNVELNEECARTALVETESGTYVIQSPDLGGIGRKRPLKIFDASDRSLRELTLELLRDVESDIPGWAEFKYSSAGKRNVEKVERRVAQLRTLAEHRWRFGDTKENEDWPDFALGFRAGWEFFDFPVRIDYLRKCRQSTGFRPSGRPSGKGPRWLAADAFLRELPPTGKLRNALRPTRTLLEKWYGEAKALHPALRGTRLLFSWWTAAAHEAEDGTLFLEESVSRGKDENSAAFEIAMKIRPQGGIESFATVFTKT